VRRSSDAGAIPRSRHACSASSIRPRAARAARELSIQYVDLVDYLALAAEVTGLSAETITRHAKLDRADSALRYAANPTPARIGD
jgi:hypothetical protein